MTDPFSSDSAKAPPKPFTSEQGRRQVRSFVLRQGRFSPAQQRAFEQHWPRFGLDFSGVPRDFDAVFGRKAARVPPPRAAAPTSTTYLASAGLHPDCSRQV